MFESIPLIQKSSKLFLHFLSKVHIALPNDFLSIRRVFEFHGTELVQNVTHVVLDLGPRYGARGSLDSMHCLRIKSNHVAQYSNSLVKGTVAVIR